MKKMTTVSQVAWLVLIGNLFMAATRTNDHKHVVEFLGAALLATMIYFHQKG